jgi:hypothetical protein
MAMSHQEGGFVSLLIAFAAVLIFHVVKMVMVVGVARSIHLTLILLRLLGSTCAMASSSFFTRHLMLLMGSKQGAPILPVPLESSLTMVIHSFPLVSDCVWDCSQGFTCKVYLLLGSGHVVKFFNVWFAFL